MKIFRHFVLSSVLLFSLLPHSGRAASGCKGLYFQEDRVVCSSFLDQLKTSEWGPPSSSSAMRLAKNVSVRDSSIEVVHSTGRYIGTKYALMGVPCTSLRANFYSDIAYEVCEGLSDSLRLTQEQDCNGTRQYESNLICQSMKRAVEGGSCLSDFKDTDKISTPYCTAFKTFLFYDRNWFSSHTQVQRWKIYSEWVSRTLSQRIDHQAEFTKLKTWFERNKSKDAAAFASKYPRYAKMPIGAFENVVLPEGGDEWLSWMDNDDAWND